MIVFYEYFFSYKIKCLSLTFHTYLEPIWSAPMRPEPQQGGTKSVVYDFVAELLES